MIFIYTYLSMLAIFVYAGITDWKRREVDDIVSIAAWALCWLAGLDTNILLASFIGIWLLAEIASHLKKPIFGWADILMVPPFFTAIAALQSYSWAGAFLSLALVASQLWLSKQRSKKKAAPLVFFLMLGLILAAVLSFVF